MDWGQLRCDGELVQRDRLKKGAAAPYPFCQIYSAVLQ